MRSAVHASACVVRFLVVSASSSALHALTAASASHAALCSSCATRAATGFCSALCVERALLGRRPGRARARHRQSFVPACQRVLRDAAAAQSASGWYRCLRASHLRSRSRASAVVCSSAAARGAASADEDCIGWSQRPRTDEACEALQRWSHADSTRHGKHRVGFWWRVRGERDSL
jgi:hypothetical protein